jgi:hypothetical protein
MDTNNKLIAIFMELETPDEIYFEHLTKEGYRSELTHFMLLEYHNSWDWLMPVVEKIENIEDNRFLFQISTRQGFYAEVRERLSYETKIEDAWGKTRIEAVYNTCVEFIKWYNLTKKK